MYKFNRYVSCISFSENGPYDIRLIFITINLRSKKINNQLIIIIQRGYGD